MIYYGQSNEDQYILDYFGDYVGTYVDVGADDGKSISNTYNLELAGWSGVCLEPHPDQYPNLQRNRPNAICVPSAAIAHDVPTIDFIDTGTRYMSGVAPDAGKIAAKNRGGWKTIQVRATTLDSLLKTLGYERVDFVSIDVEGTELDVLEGFDLARWQPRLLCIENNDPRTAGLDAYMRERGYIKVKQIEINAFYAPAK